jgi:Secretion system C-terminal sorting domain
MGLRYPAGLPAVVFAGLVTTFQAVAQQNLWEHAGSVSGAVQCLGVTTSNIVYAGTDSGLYVSSDHGETWRNIADPQMSDGIACLLVTSDDSLFAGTKAGLFHWRPVDESWERVFASTFTWVNAMVEGKNGEIFIAAADSATGLAGSLYRSQGKGGGWSEVASGLIGDDVTIGFLADTAGSVYVLTNGGGVILQDVFYAWDPDNEQWNIRSFMGALFIQALGCDRDNTFWGPEGHGVAASTDGGVTWLGRDMWPNTCNVIDIRGGNERAAVGTMTRGVYYTDDGWNWTQAGSGIPINPVLHDSTVLDPVFALKYDHEGRLFAGTRDYGIYRSLDLATEVRESKPVIQGFSLEQNYPNPFNPETSIPFSVSQRTKVTIRVFDLLGQQVATLLDKETPPGHYTVRWNAIGFPSGTYVVSMTAEVYSSSRPVVLLK